MTENPFPVPPKTPGIYPDLAFSTYLRINAISNTALGLMEQSPLHYHEAVALETKKFLVVGELVHAGRLEPESFAERYVVQPEFHLDPRNVKSDGTPSDSKATTFCKEKVKEFTAANFGKKVVPKEWYDEARAIVAALHADRRANSILNAAGPVELTIIFEDPETGLLCKARIDKAAVAVGCLGDLKTTEDLGKFAKNLAYFGYHRQAAHYQTAWSVACGDVLDFWIIAVEKKRPRCVAAAPLHEESLECGHARRRAAMRRIAECLDSDQWPGPPVPDSWRVPQWELEAGPDLELSFGDGTVATL